MDSKGRKHLDGCQNLTWTTKNRKSLQAFVYNKCLFKMKLGGMSRKKKRLYKKPKDKISPFEILIIWNDKNFATL